MCRLADLDILATAYLSSENMYYIPVGWDITFYGSSYYPGFYGSSDPDGGTGPSWAVGIRKWAWNFGDGSQSYCEEVGETPGDGMVDGKTTHEYTTPGCYQLTFTATDNDQEEGGQEDHTDTYTCWITAVEVGVSGGGYICVGGMDEIQLSVNPDNDWTDCKVRLSVFGDYRYCIKIWTDQNKSSLVIPNGRFLDNYYKDYDPGSLPSELYVEGISTTPAGPTEDVDIALLYRVDSLDVDQDAIDYKVVDPEVDYVTVIENATQMNGSKNWAAVKKSGEYVIVKAVLDPDIPESEVPEGLITWTGGDPVTGHPLQRKVSKNTSAKTSVTATIDSSSDYVDIWILWSTCEFRMDHDDDISEGNSRLFPTGYGGLGLGEYSDEDEVYFITVAETMGKIEAVFTLSPTGVYNVVSDGWDIKRWKTIIHYENGSSDDGVVSDDDTSAGIYKDLVPDDDDKIYDLDAPQCGSGFNIDHTKEVYDNFRQWCTWNGTKCSDDYYWYYRAQVDDDLDAENKPDNDDTELNDLGTGQISSFPPSNTYEPR